LRLILLQEQPAGEVIVVDQTPVHDRDSELQLTGWEQAGRLRRIRLAKPSVTAAMNRGLRAARGDWVLFLDDDIIPGHDLVVRHGAAAAAHPEAWAVAGQVLQPGESSEASRRDGAAEGLRQDLGFKFSGNAACWVTNVMAGNLCVNRKKALESGGFDERFGPPVAFRFETEFAKRMILRGGRIWFEPTASVQHLRAASGGTRSRGSHLVSASPLHGVGDYYYALRCGRGWDRVRYMLRRPFREVRTRFHLGHPWWIPVKLLGEVRALLMALRWYRCGPRLEAGG
jgi:GT2 family glycosyltransferase